MIRITKTIDKDGFEWLNTDDLFNYIKETDKKFGCYYEFVKRVAEYVHYYNNNTSTAFGNPDYERMGGVLVGFCLAKEWIYKENKDNIIVLDKRERKLFEFEKPCISKMELDKRKEIQKMLDELL